MADDSTSLSDILGGGDSSMDALMKRFSSNMSETDAMTNQLGESARLQRGIASRFLTDRPPPPPEIPAPAPPPPGVPQRSAWEEFGGAAAVLGILGGLHSTFPLTASLRAATGAVNGYRQRDLTTYQQNYEQWKAQSEYAGRLAEWQQDRYKQALDLYKDNHDELTAALSAISAADKDIQAQHALKTGDLSVFTNLMRFREEAIDRYGNMRLRADEDAERKRHDLVEEDINRKRASVISGKATQKVDEQIKELQFLKGDVQSLLDRVNADPSLVGAKGLFRRGIQTVTGQLSSAERERQEKQDKAAVGFKADMVALQARLMPLIHARYFSGPAAKMAEEMVSGLDKYDDPEAAKASLNTLSRLLDQDIATKSQVSQEVNQDLRSLSDEDLLQRLEGR